MGKKSLHDVELTNKIVLVRVDFNVPMKNQAITDNNRIVAALPTIQYLIKHQAKIVLFSHLGRIKTTSDLDKNNLMPVAQELSSLMNNYPVKFVNAIEGTEVETAIKALKNGEIILLQNTRYADIKASDGSIQIDSEGKAFLKRESKNNPELGKYWASLGNVFVNDAFGTAHRAHASNVGISSNIATSCVGFLVEKELKMLSQGIDNPAHPFVAIIGGAKVSDKIGVINNLLAKADKILIGGGMTYTFYAAQGHKVGRSLLESDKIAEAKEFLDRANGKIILPIDSLAAKEFADVEPTIIDGCDIPGEYMGLDIGPKSIALFANELQGAKTVVWNGPMGVFEFSNYNKGTLAICQTIANLKDAFTLIGGGDSAAAAIQLGFKEQFTHISTGGGASLEYMEGKILPGIQAIQNK